jgi:hypothetical protein
LNSFALETLFSNIDVRAVGRFRCGIQFGDSQRKNAEGGSWALIFNCGWLEWQDSCRFFVYVGALRHLTCSICNLLVIWLLGTLSQWYLKRWVLWRCPQSLVSPIIKSRTTTCFGILLVMTMLYWSASCTLTNPGVTLGILIITGFGGFPSLAAVQGPFI